MSAIITAIIVLVVVAIVGFVTFIIMYHLKQRRNGMPTSGILPPADAFKSVFTGNRGGSSRGGGSGGDLGLGGGGLGNAFGLGRTTGERSTRFAALDVDEAWDSHVDEEMGYGNPRAKSQGSSGHDRNMGGRLSHDELDSRYDAVMDGTEEEQNPFGSGAYDAKPGSSGSDRKSAFKESV